MNDYEVWDTMRPITFQGSVVEWVLVKSHLARRAMGVTLCGRYVRQAPNGPWERGRLATPPTARCKTCFRVQDRIDAR